MAVAFRYIARETALLFCGVFALLLVVGLGGRFLGFLQQAAVGRFAADKLWLLLALRVPEFVQVTAPFALFLALLLVFGRLHAEREYVALTSGGARPGRMLAWALASALPVAAVVGALAFVVTPQAGRAYRTLSLEQRLESEVDAVVPGTFQIHSRGRATYVQSVDRDARRLEGVFMAQREGANSMTMWAERGRQHRSPETGSRFLELEDGRRYEGAPGTHGYRVVEFRRLGQRLRREPLPPISDVRSTPTVALALREPGPAAELQARLAAPLMALVSALLAFGIARPPPRAGRFARLLPGVGLFLGYYLLLVLAQDAAAEGAVPPHLGVLAVHLAALLAAVWLIRRSMRPMR